MQKKECLYYAFVSYRHIDQEWAKWLKHKLQAYRLPTRTFKQHQNLPKRLSPIFYDVNLLPGRLNEQIKEELRSSKYLIVLCSKAVVEKPDWIDDEIRFFLENGRDRSRIIPVIVDKVENPVEETFPPLLKKLNQEETILGIDIPKVGKRLAILKIVSYIQGIKLEELESEDGKRRKKKAWILSAIVSIFLLAAVIGGYKWWDYYVPKEKCYANYVEKEGVPIGIGDLSKDQMMKMEAHYRIRSEKGRVVSLRHENSSNQLVGFQDTLDTDKYIYAEFEYLASGVIEKVSLYDTNKKPLKVYDYNGLGMMTVESFADELGISEEMSHASNTLLADVLDLELTNNKANIYKYALIYKDGFLVEKRYSDKNNKVAFDENGIAGERYERYSNGLIKTTRYLTYTGKEHRLNDGSGYKEFGGRNGVFGIRFEYTDLGLTKAIQFFGSEEEPVYCGRQYSKETFSYDENNNRIVEEYFDVHNNLVFNSEGYSFLHFDHNEFGEITKKEYYGTDGKPILHKNGFASVETEYDDRGNVIKASYYGTDGKPILLKEGWASYECEIDDRGNEIKASFYGTDGKPILNKNGFASVETEYDDRGNEIKVSFYGTDGKPILDKDGNAGLEYEYDDRGNEIKRSYYGTDGKPILHKDGYASYECEYDDRGNEIKQSFYGIDGKPILYKNGYASSESEYDDRDNEIKASFYGTDGKPILHKDGYHSGEIEYDDRGNVIKVSYYGTDGELVLTSNGYAIVDVRRDEKGDIIEIRHYGIEGELLATGQRE